MGIFYGLANIPNLSTLALGKNYLIEVIVYSTALLKDLLNSK